MQAQVNPRNGDHQRHGQKHKSGARGGGHERYRYRKIAVVCPEGKEWSFSGFLKVFVPGSVK